LKNDICDANTKIVMPFHHITSPINGDANKTKTLRIISEHNPTMASRLRTDPDTPSYVVVAAEYASDVAAATGNTSALKELVVRDAFEGNAAAETHAQKCARGLMEQTSESRFEEVHQPDTGNRAWRAWKDTVLSFGVVVMSFVPVDA
jgi:hypothetical protein